MSDTMTQMKKVLNNISELKSKQEMMRLMFENSMGELSDCFHWIMEAWLDGRNHTALTLTTCPELYAKELKGIGFYVEEIRNCFNTLCGYDISWNR